MSNNCKGYCKVNSKPSRLDLEGSGVWYNLNMTGRWFGYYLNAYKDNFLAQEFIKDKALISAYTQFCWNGLYDFMMAEILKKFSFGEKKKKALKLVKEFRNELKIENDFRKLDKKLSLLKPLLMLLFGRLHYWNEFLEMFNLQNIKISKKEIVLGMIKTQKQNIHSNYLMIEKFKKEEFDDLKLKYIKLGEENGICSKSVLKTLKAASRWDKLFIFILKFRFGV